jgi:ligand-binding SRPBCC domain-containing protein
MPYRLVAKQVIAKKPEEIFPFFADAKNLERITPPWLNFRILNQSTPEIQEGTIFNYALSLHGIPVRWRSEIREWSVNKKFVDQQLKGPYRIWHHTHLFEVRDSGTLMTDVVRYDVALGRLGEVFAGAWVKSDVTKIFQYRGKVISEFFPAEPVSVDVVYQRPEELFLSQP